MPVNEALIRGGEIHGMMEKYYKILEKKGEYLIPEALAEAGLLKYPEYANSICKFDTRRGFNTPFKEFLPEYAELKIENTELGIVGIVDRIDKWHDNLRMVIEYKTGKSHDSISKYRFELAIYKILFESKYPDKKITHWAVWFLKNGKLLMEETKDISVRCALTKIEKVRKQIEEEEKWNRSMTPLCDWCEYQQQCMRKVD